MDKGQMTGSAIELDVGGVKRVFDIDNPELPGWVKKRKLTSGGYPYDKKLDKDEYQETLERLQVELVKLLAWMETTGERVVAVFEGRDAAGKGGTIDALRRYMNPRRARNVALSKPTETERGQWYYQRYVAHFPSHGEFVTFDRSWYNRAGVEPLMGFCTPEQYARFLAETPQYELTIVRDGMRLFKFWLDIGQETQLKRFHDRRHSTLTNWKFSPIDLAGMAKWAEYGEARDRMIEATHTEFAPWTIVRSNDKRRARIEVIRRVLQSIPYGGKEEKAIGEPDKRIIGNGPEFLPRN
ncbi:polyphosphate kinase 2 [Pseudaminobacter sp. 19-2017]|uniref:ADP/GDP-polyphosphate phosphotransferase n=1 Tax=Pseudaminobacter soli (ex Zhang et al. 2022) TaxID=2831468 RepID=A0A942DWF5_9HYPH|nr:polyphosphate kinase 2 [Pseudaminobacter soli]MBS3648554.1 polyphosphate kinase 2 [Pseudaminobacter soli]